MNIMALKELKEETVKAIRLNVLTFLILCTIMSCTIKKQMKNDITPLKMTTCATDSLESTVKILIDSICNRDYFKEFNKMPCSITQVFNSDSSLIQMHSQLPSLDKLLLYYSITRDSIEENNILHIINSICNCCIIKGENLYFTYHFHDALTFYCLDKTNGHNRNFIPLPNMSWDKKKRFKSKTSNFFMIRYEEDSFD